MWLYDASDSYSRSSSELNDAMIKAMKRETNHYDGLPNAILENRPYSQSSRNPNADTANINRDIRSRDFGKRLDINQEFDWVYK